MTARLDALPPRDPAAEPYPALAEKAGERPLLIGAAVAAVLLHGLAFVIDLPERRAAPLPEKPPLGPRIFKTTLPPPPLPATTHRERVDTMRRTPIPMADPETAPVVEPPAVPEDRTLVSLEIELPFADPVAPPRPAGPVPMSPTMTPPRLIEATKVRPEYPQIGRVAGLSGNVVLQAVIHTDGSVGGIVVLQVKPPGLGFEHAATAAVAQWRYEPALQAGQPVEVYFTIVVNFDLH